MDVLYTINNKYLDIMLTSLYSLILNGNLEFIRLHVVTLDFEKEDLDKLKRFVNMFPSVELYTYKLEDNPIDDYKIPSWRGNQIANARLFYPRIINDKSGSIENILYIDSDTIIVDDLSGLSKYDENAVNACKDGTLKSYYEDRFGIKNYYNTGVLYINVDKWLNLDVEGRVIDFYKHNDKIISFPDQDTFNVILQDEINSIPIRYNMVTYPYAFNDLYLRLFYNDKIRQLGYEEITREKDNAKILHSAGICNIKPWTNNKINPFNNKFMEYMEEVNPNFEKEELSKTKKLLTLCPPLFYTLIMIRTYFPRKIDEVGRQISLKIQHALDNK